MRHSNLGSPLGIAAEHSPRGTGTMADPAGGSCHSGLHPQSPRGAPEGMPKFCVTVFVGALWLRLSLCMSVISGMLGIFSDHVLVVFSVSQGSIDSGTYPGHFQHLRN